MGEGVNIKDRGNPKYKTGGVEPIDLYEANGSLQHFAVDNIIKYAFRNSNGPVNPNDLEKIHHYTDMLVRFCTSKKEGKPESVVGITEKEWKDMVTASGRGLCVTD